MSQQISSTAGKPMDIAKGITDFDYMGLSGEVLKESVAGEVTKSYQYSP
ncbi:hypothetical protein ACHZ98_34195 [Streptomyces sp. MAR4 CNY-716]